jgi:hypothetical protein
LHTGKPSKHGPEGGKVHIGLFQPPPANFHDYKRFYNRTDAQLHKYISEGIYPTAMPRWYGRIDKDKKYVFDDEMLWKVVRYVRTFSYKNDLPDTAPVPPGINLTTHNNQWYKPQSSLDVGFSQANPIPAALTQPATSHENSTHAAESQHASQAGDAH